MVLVSDAQQLFGSQSKDFLSSGLKDILRIHDAGVHYNELY